MLYNFRRRLFYGPSISEKKGTTEKKMAKKEDLRIIKTKAALTNAFYAMLEEMSLEEITVNDLCEKAEVRRATFYKHFNDKNDFIIYLIKDVRERFEVDVWSKESCGCPSKEYYKKYDQ